MFGGVEKRASVVVAAEQAAYLVSGNGKLIGLLFCFNFIYCIANHSFHDRRETNKRQAFILSFNKGFRMKLTTICKLQTQTIGMR